jgi:alpha-L-arabinofuranosidase
MMFFAVGGFISAMVVQGQSPLYIYTNNLVNGFQDWSWATRNMENTSPVYSGSNSISVSDGTYEGISFHQNDFNDSLYTNLTFWANGGTNGGQQLQVYLSLDTNDLSGVALSPLLPKNAWQQYNVSLASLGAANATNLARVTIWMINGSGTYYLDNIQLSPTAAPSLVHLGVNATNTLRTADARWFGLNTATWDGELGNSQTLPMVEAAGVLAFRWPGGSTSDGYNWASDISGNDTFINLVTNAGVGTNCFVTVNYGSGTSNEAAAFVKFLNITNHCHIGNWEVGNECYGTWEEDNNNVPHDPYTYATRAAGYISLMRAADPTIKVGVVVVPGEDSYSNNADHYAVNPVTGQIHYGWTPVMFNTLSNLGVMPDFVIYHDYPQYTATGNAWEPNSPDSDPLLLQIADTPSTLWTDWASAAANLRQQITDYLGPQGTNIQLCVTENNSDSGAMGRQSTSVVNALYMADSLSQLMKTEFNSYVWWDLHNGPDTTGDFDPTLYGWRTNGDYGVLNGSDVPYPTYYAEKLMQSFVRPGDTILNATSDSLALSAYAARKADGSLAMLVINKTPTNVLSGQISLTNFTPASGGVMRSYGITQDEETRTNGLAATQDIYTNGVSVASNFTNSFPPYSLTLFTFEPVASQLGVSSVSVGQVVLSLQGQSGAPYVIESSTDLVSWNMISTNTLSGTMMTVTNAVSPVSTAQYWRAVWLP